MDGPNYWKRLSKRRIPRRGFLAGAATAAVGLAATAAGCGSGSGGTGTQTRRPAPTGAASPVSGGEITWGRDTAVLGIDPHVDLTGLDIDSCIYSNLYDWNANTQEAEFTDLAQTLEQPEPVTFIFTLRPGVLTHPGSYPDAGAEITSEDVKQSFIRRSTALTAIDKRMSHKIAGSAEPSAFPPALQTPDKYTFSFTMAEYFAPALREMANATWAIVPAKAIEKYGLNLGQVAFGSGPFMLDEYIGNQRIVLKKFPQYFNQGHPYLDSITRVIITDESSLLVAFKNGQHDVNGAILTKQDYDDLLDDSDFVVGKAPNFFYPVIHIKIKPPFDDIRVRQALDMAIDRDQLIQVTQDGEGDYNGPVQWAQTNWCLPQQELRDFYKYDPDSARQLLADAGYGGGFKTKMKFPHSQPGFTRVGDTAILLKEYWSKIGIEVELDDVELGAFIGSTLLPGNFDLAFFSNVPSDEPDRPLAFYHSLGVTGAGNWNSYTNPDLDTVIDAQSREFDEDKRRDLIWQAQRMILREHGPQIALTGGYQYSAHWSYVHFPGEGPEDDALSVAENIWTEHT